MKCSNCGKEVPEGKKFCGFCGFNLAETQSEVSEQAKTIRGRKKSTQEEEPRTIVAKEEKSARRKAAPPDGVLAAGKMKLPRWVLPAGLAVVGLAAAALILPVLFQPSPQPQTESVAPQEPSAPKPVELPADSESEAEPTPDLAAPLPKEVTAILDGAQTLYYSNCSDIDSSFFSIEESEENIYSEGGMIITRADGIFWTSQDLIPGNAVLVKFMLEADDETRLMVGIQSGSEEDDYQEMGITARPGDFYNYVFHGDLEYQYNVDHRFSEMEEIDFDKWYYSLFTVLEERRVNLRVWPEADPSEYVERTEDFEIPPSKDTWSYYQCVIHSGFIYLDDLWTLEFEALK